ncbi:ATP-binding protein [Rhodococcus gordoniae]|nr:ATP-binding protein [Rhodococcus gordoniae]
MDAASAIKPTLEQAGIAALDIQQREFPGEFWVIVTVDPDLVAVGQSLAGELETRVKAPDGSTVTVLFRGSPPTTAEEPVSIASGRLHDSSVDRLIQLLEARSRTSDAVPSLSYMEDPRASLNAIASPRHHLIYGRRGVGKTALLLEVKRIAELEGHVAVWINTHTLRRLSAEAAFSVVIDSVLENLILRIGSSSSGIISTLDELRHKLVDDTSEDTAVKLIPDLNRTLRRVLRPGLLRLYVFLDDFYLLDSQHQPRLLDHLAGVLRDCDGWIKVASIERLTRPFEVSTRVGIEPPHDALIVNLDVTLEDPESTQKFLESVLESYLSTAGIRSARRIAKVPALGRLVLASGGVPRDYLNLFSASILAARKRSSKAAEIGKEDVAAAAGLYSQSKKRDLEQDVAGRNSAELLSALETLKHQIKDNGSTYFKVDLSMEGHPGYEVLANLVDMRFAHLVQSSISDPHRPGVKHEAYVLALSEYTDVRLHRGLDILDIEDGNWLWQKTGKAGTAKNLTRTEFRGKLRQAPILNLDRLALHSQ